jgi:vacuolar protein sorting-associated protein 52
MLRMAAIFPQRKEQLIYLINNYDLILGILMERTRDNTKEAESFREQLSARSNEYVEEILSPHIGGIIHFVKECEKDSVSHLHPSRIYGRLQKCFHRTKT